MSIKADCHLHSSFSGDSKAPMPEMIDKGISLGLETMCFTEHNDFDYPNTEEGPGSIFLLNTDSYLYDILRCRAKYEENPHFPFVFVIRLAAASGRPRRRFYFRL